MLRKVKIKLVRNNTKKVKCDKNSSENQIISPKILIPWKTKLLKKAGRVSKTSYGVSCGCATSHLVSSL